MTTALSLPNLPPRFGNRGAASASTPDEVLREVQSSASLRLYGVTWNMHGKTAPEEDFTHHLFPRDRYHLIAIGTEECERTIAQSMIFPSKERWERQLTSAVGDSYFPVGSATLGAIHLMVFAHVGLRKVISDVQTASVPCGFANTVGNKGGVGVAFNVGGTSFLIINSHFAAFQKNVAARNANYRRIERALPLVPALFGLESRLRITQDAEHLLAAAKKEADAAAAAAVLTSGAHEGSTAKPAVAVGSHGAAEDDEEEEDEEAPDGKKSVKKLRALTSPVSPDTPSGLGPKEAWASSSGRNAAKAPTSAGPATATTAELILTPDTAVSRRYHRVIFMGDMNYRCDCTREQADDAIARKDLGYLLQRDQLTAERAAHSALVGFEEGAIDFLPTYKLDKGTDDYDTGEKRRIPAWTDRILYRASSDIFPSGHSAAPTPAAPAPPVSTPSAGAGAGASPSPSPSFAVNAEEEAASTAFTKSVMALHFYTSLSALKHSDHRPVAAGFTIQLQGAPPAPPPAVVAAVAGGSSAVPVSSPPAPSVALATPPLPSPTSAAVASAAADDWPAKKSPKLSGGSGGGLGGMFSCCSKGGSNGGRGARVVPVSVAPPPTAEIKAGATGAAKESAAASSSSS